MSLKNLDRRIVFLTLDCRFVLDLFSERKAVTAWDPVEGESHLDTLLRAIVISRLGRAGDQVPLKTYISIMQYTFRKFELKQSEGLTPTAQAVPASPQISGLNIW